MTKTIDEQQVAALRDYNYHRTPQRRVQSFDAAVSFVNEVGFAFFWPIKGIEGPSLFHAIAGRVRDVPNVHNDPDLSPCWDWKDQALDKRVWYYAKVLRRRACLISLDLLPMFYALSPNYGDYTTDHLEAYEAGELSAEAKAIYEALLHEGPLHTIRLRRAAHLGAESAKSRFKRALTELQVRLQVLPVGVADAGAWHYAFIYKLVPRHYPDLPAQARPIARADARAALVRTYLDNVVAATQKQIGQIFHVLGWTPRELSRTLQGLHDSNIIVETTIEGLQGKHWVSTRALT
jgi:hypothetical protein